MYQVSNDTLRTHTLKPKAATPNIGKNLSEHENSFSGYFNGVDFSLFPEVVKKEIRELDPYSFSFVFKNFEAAFLLYKYTYSPPSKATVDNNWFELEELALNKKRIDLFNLWITNQKEKIHIEVFDF